MESNLLLTIEQMKHLQELGLKIKYATCSYDIHKPSNTCEVVYGYKPDTNDVLYETIPAFSLFDIVNLLPSYIENDKGTRYWLTFEKVSNDNNILWDVKYNFPYYNFYIKEFLDKNLMNAAYNMLCWLIENNFIKNKTYDIWN